MPYLVTGLERDFEGGKGRGNDRLAFVVSHPSPKSGEGWGTHLCGLGEEGKS